MKIYTFLVIEEIKVRKVMPIYAIMVCCFQCEEETRGSQAKKFGEKGMNFAKKSYVEWKKSDGRGVSCVRS